MAFHTNSTLRRTARIAWALAICAGFTTSSAEAKKHRPGKGARSSTALPSTTAPEPDPNAPATEPPPPYEPQILRLAEILGALSYLDDLCGGSVDRDWRMKMQGLIEAEAKTKFQKERLAGNFNRSFRGYQISYRACTPNAQVVIGRFLAEGGRIAHEVVDRYGAS